MVRIRRIGIISILCVTAGLVLAWGVVQAAKNIVIIPAETEHEVSTKVGQYGELNVTFSGPIVDLSDYDTMLSDINKKVKISISPALKGKIRVIDNQSLAYVFEERPARSTRYTVNINASAIKDLQNRPVDTRINYTQVRNDQYIYNTSRIYVSSVYCSGQELKPMISIYLNQDTTYTELKKSLSIGNRSTSYEYRLVPQISTNTVKTTVDTVFATVQTNLSTWYAFPQGLTPALKYDVRIQSGLMGSEGNLGSERTYSQNYHTYYPFKFVSFSSSDYEGNYYPNSSVRFEFNNDIHEKLSSIRVSSVPAVDDLKFSVSGRFIYVEGSFSGGKSYKISLQGPFKDIYGQSFTSEVNAGITFDHLWSYFNVPTGYMVMESYMEAILPLKIRNVSGFSIRYKYLSRLEDMIEYLQLDWNERNVYLDNNASTEKLDVKWSWDRFYNYRYDMAKHINSKSGLLLFKFVPDRENPTEYSSEYEKGDILYTDLGVSVKASPYEVVVFVRNLKSNAPVKDAIVYEVQGKNLVKKGLTDGQGVLKYENDQEFYPFIAVDYKGSYGLNYSASTVRWGDEYNYNQARLQLFTERYLYKAGEEVELKGIVRYRAMDNWVINDVRNNKAYKFTINNSRGEELTNYTAYFDSWGGTHSTIHLPSDAPSGFYSVYAYLDNDYVSSLTFRVEDYKPAKAEMKIIPLQANYQWGQEFKGDLIGWYLFGAPVIKPINYKINVEPATFYSKNFKKYSFGVDYWDEQDRRDYSFTLDSGKLMPDKNGKLSVSSLLAKDDFKGDGLITFSGSTELDDKSTVYGARSGIGLYNPVQIGMYMDQYFVDAGKAFDMHLIAIDPEEHILDTQKVILELIKWDWKSVKRAGVNGRLSWEWVLEKEVVSSQTLSLGRKTVSLTVSDPGYYKARVKTVVRGHEAMSEYSFYALGKGSIGWRMDDGYYLDVESDKQEYEVGDEARILVKNPYKTATAVITYEREKFHKVERIEVSDSMLILPVKITEEFIPNMYISVMLYAGRTGKGNVDEWGEDLSRPSFRMGLIDLKVIPKEKKLNIILSSDKKKYEPGQKATVTVDLRDYKGDPAEGEVVLAVVDKGVLNLVNYRMPDPLSVFYAPRPLAVTTREMTELIVGQRYLAEKGEVIGGGGDLPSVNGSGKDGMIVPRSNFKTTAFYNARVIVTKGKKATLSFTVPDNLTSFVVMAVAHTKQSQFGSGEEEFAVSKPLMLLPTLPQFLRIKDTVEAGGMVYNYSGKDAEITVTLQGEKPIEYIGANVKKVKIPQNGSAEVLFNFRVPNTVKDKLKFKIVATSGKLGDGIETSIPLEMPKMYETTALYKYTEDSAKETIKISDNVWRDMSRIQVDLSPSAFSELKGNVDYLIKYPYGCLEQRCSQILPLLLGEEIITKQGLLQDKTAAELRAIVQDTINLIPKYWSNNGFSYYPGGYGPYPYLSVYTTFILNIAKQKGYTVSQALLDKATRYVKDIANGKGDFRSRWNYSTYYSTLTRAYALYVASMNGYQNVPTLKSLQLELKNKGEDNLAAWAYLLKTAAHYSQFSGADKIKEELAAHLLSRARLEAQTLYFEAYDDWGWFYYDNVVTTSLVLQALVESDTEFADSYKVIKWLIRARKAAHWETTHANAIVFYAMSTYLNKFEKEEPNFLATVRVDGYTLLRQMFESRTAPVLSKGFKIKDQDQDQIQFELTKAGKGRLYYLIQYQYLLKQYPVRRDLGFSLEKKIYDYSTGAEIKDNVFKRGQRYIVKIKVYTPKDRTFAVVNDSLPAGFEPVNLDFATEENEKGVQTGTDQWWGSFYHVEQYKDKVLFLSDYLNKGSHELTYVVRATTGGNYEVPQLRAEEMYAPEVFGTLYQKDVVIK